MIADLDQEIQSWIKRFTKAEEPRPLNKSLGYKLMSRLEPPGFIKVGAVLLVELCFVVNQILDNRILGDYTLNLSRRVWYSIFS